MSSTRREIKGYVGVLIALLAVVILDQLSKYSIVSNLPEGHGMPVINGFFDLTLVYNPGAAFGALAGLSDRVRPFILGAATFLALGAVLYFLLVDYWNDKLAKIFLGLIIGGALGNVIDRFRMGRVVDFLDFYFGSYHWPAFNIADSAICLGVALLMIKSLMTSPKVK